jgi:guanine deaminase
VPFVDDHFPPALLDELSETKATPPAELLAFAEDLAARRNHRDHRVAFVAAPSAPQRCSDGFLEAVRDMADRRGAPVIIHVHETRLQVVTAQAFYGKSMFAHLADLGFLKPATSLIHAVWARPADLDLIAAAGASVQHNPVSNLKLGSGLAPIRAMLDRGINVALGSDGCGSIESVDMLRVLASSMLLHSLREGDHADWITPAEAFRAATEGGATALGRTDIGRIAVGAKADIALYDTRSIAFAPLNDPLQQLTLAETGRALRHVIVDGAPVLRDGALTRIDEAGVIGRIHEAAAALSPEIAASERSVERLREPYEAIWRRCCAEPIPADVYPARIPRAPDAL